ncbi:MAG TPA: hypothetical protein VMT59_02320 [Gaiellaceae bacterium]|nr:hypothetical protein [Gaiellaceae bacterium]
MHLRKTIVLVALAAVTAAPSALALRPPIDAGEPGTHILTSESGLQKRAKPANKPQPKLCQRGIDTPGTCLAFGLQ